MEGRYAKVSLFNYYYYYMPTTAHQDDEIEDMYEEPETFIAKGQGDDCVVVTGGLWVSADSQVTGDFV